MTDKRILFGEFEFPRIHGLEYLLDEEKNDTSYLFVNEPHDRFSMYFEEGFPRFTVPEHSDREYCLFEIKRQERRISFFCPERKRNLDSVVWYFFVELFDANGVAHELPGQVRVSSRDEIFSPMRERPKFIDVLEQIRLNEETGIA